MQEILTEKGVENLLQIVQEHANHFGLNDRNASLLGLLKKTRRIVLELKV